MIESLLGGVCSISPFNIFTILSLNFSENLILIPCMPISNLCRIFRLRGVHKMFGGSDFSRVERIFTIWQRPKIWGKFSKYALKLIKNGKNNEKIREKMQIFQKIF